MLYFISGALSSVENDFINDGVDNNILKIASSAARGGAISEIDGDKFANGAIIGAYSIMFNEMMHGGGEEQKKKLEKIKKNPPNHPEYKSPQGGDRKVNHPRGNGWIDKKGRVCIQETHDGHEAPHWDRQELKGGGYTKIYPCIQPDPSWSDKLGQIVGLSGTCFTIYIFVSEGSRLFPPRNFIPAPNIIYDYLDIPDDTRSPIPVIPVHSIINNFLRLQS